MNGTHRDVTRALQLAVIQILDATQAQLDHEQPLFGAWSVQGFGLLRLYIRNVGRLHIWNSDLCYPGVSTVHNHAWDLESAVVCGELLNTKYNEFPIDSTRSETTTYNKVRLKTGFDSLVLDEPTQVKLYAFPTNAYRPGDRYFQHADEIHRTNALDGTVTIMQRKDTVGDGQADVFWPYGTSWGTAKPRAATNDEVRAGIELAMRWLNP